MVKPLIEPLEELGTRQQAFRQAGPVELGLEKDGVLVRHVAGWFLRGYSTFLDASPLQRPTGVSGAARRGKQHRRGEGLHQVGLAPPFVPAPWIGGRAACTRRPSVDKGRQDVDWLGRRPPGYPAFPACSVACRLAGEV
jgi:hypothetical protein